MQNSTSTDYAMNNTSAPLGPTRREFLKTSSKLMAGAAVAATMPSPGYAAENNTIKIALVGCGGRGGGAVVQALSTKGPTKLVALADVFQHRVDGTYKSVSDRFASQVDCPPERRFIGLDAYKKAID